MSMETPAFYLVLFLPKQKDLVPIYILDVPNKEWDIPDPSGKSVAFMRKIRNDIEEMVDSLICSKWVRKDSPFET